MKILYFDVETTGLYANTDELFQLAVILEKDNTVVFEKDYRCCPSQRAIATMHPKALEAHGIKPETMLLYPLSQSVQKEFVEDLSKHINKYDTTDKATPCAYNGHFDLSFLSAWFKLHGDEYLGSFINWNLIDPLAVIHFLESLSLFPPIENHKLLSVANLLSIPIVAHDALSDVRALRAIHKRLLDSMRIELDTEKFLVRS